MIIIWGTLQPSLWSLANIKCVAADIKHGVADILLHGAAIILRGMASILSNVHDILHVQHQYFEIFLIVLGFPKVKIHFFSKVLRNYSSCQKLIIFFF